jgi:aspartyl protease
MRSSPWLCVVALTVSSVARADAPAADPPADAIVAELPFLESREPNRIFLNLAKDGDRDFRLLLDTGASDTVLTPQYARDLGVTVRRVRDRPNERDTRLGRPLQFWIDTQSSDQISRTGFEYGLLGGVFLGEYVLDLDFPARKVRFIDPDRWQVPSSVTAPDEAVLPARIVGNRVFVNVELEGKSVDVLLDTGDPFSAGISGPSARKAGFDRAPLVEVATGGVLGKIEAYLVEAEKLSFGPFDFAPAPILLQPHGGYNMGGSTDSAIGYELLQHFQVRIDYRHKRLWLKRTDQEPLGWFGQPWAAVRRTGVMANVDASGVQIEAVIADSPAAKMGLRAGDQIESHGDKSKDKALEETLAAIERHERILVVRPQKEDEPPLQLELGGDPPPTPAN